MPLENLIQRADLNLRLTRALEIKGQKSPILQLDNIVTPSVIVEDLTVQQEYAQPVRKRAGFCEVIAGVAAQTPLAVIFNPVGSGIVAVVRFFWLAPTATSQFIAGFADPAALPATAQTPIYFDNRNTGLSPILCRTGTDAALRIVGELMRINTGTTTAGTPMLPEPAEIVLNAGQAFGVQGNVLAQGGDASLWWDEYPL